MLPWRFLYCSTETEVRTCAALLRTEFLLEPIFIGSNVYGSDHPHYVTARKKQLKAVAAHARYAFSRILDWVETETTTAAGKADHTFRRRIEVSTMSAIA